MKVASVGERRAEGKEERSVPGEGKIVFDIRTVLRIPGTADAISIKILVDVEPQKDASPGYDITERAIYYCGRMLSSQLSVEFSNSTADTVKYGNLRKVYSIWVCFDVPQEKANTMERYRMQREVFPPDAQFEAPRYDLLEVVLINLSENQDAGDVPIELLHFLTDLFDKTVNAEEKVKKLKSEYGLPTTVEFEKGVADMTGFAELYERRGERRGEQNERARTITALLRNGQSAEDIAEILSYDIEEVKKVEAEMLASV